MNILEQFLRKKAATQIARAIKEERSGDIKADRSGADYIRSFLGLRHLFDYIRSLDTQTILDCGAGDTKGISELAKAGFSSKLKFCATVLRPIDDKVEAHLGRSATFRTPIETLKGLGRRKFDAILALNSLAYSQAPELAVTSIDTHLTNGGILKATFVKPIYKLQFDDWSTHHDFSRQLSILGYDLAIEPNKADKKVDVLVAVKNGADGSARAILEKDMSDWVQQYKMLK